MSCLSWEDLLSGQSGILGTLSETGLIWEGCEAKRGQYRGEDGEEADGEGRGLGNSTHPTESQGFQSRASQGLSLEETGDPIDRD